MSTIYSQESWWAVILPDHTIAMCLHSTAQWFERNLRLQPMLMVFWWNKQAWLAFSNTRLKLKESLIRKRSHFTDSGTLIYASAAAGQHVSHDNDITHCQILIRLLSAHLLWLGAKYQPAQTDILTERRQWGCHNTKWFCGDKGNALGTIDIYKKEKSSRLGLSYAPKSDHTCTHIQALTYTLDCQSCLVSFFAFPSSECLPKISWSDLDKGNGLR